MKFLLYWEWRYAMSRASGIKSDRCHAVDHSCKEMRQECESEAYESYEKQGTVSNPGFNFSVSAPHSLPSDRERRSEGEKFGLCPNPWLTGWRLAAEFVCFFPGCPNLAASDKPSPKHTKTHFWVLDTGAVVAEFNFILISSIVWRTSRAWTLPSCCVSVFSASID